MKKIIAHFNKFYQENHKSVVLGMVTKNNEITKFYTNLYNIDRLEVALLEEGTIDPEVTLNFIKELKALLLPIAFTDSALF